MAHFIVTFRIGSGEGYQDRYSSFVKKLQELGGGVGEVWEETTSFTALTCNRTAEGLRDALYLQTEFSDSKDLMIVIDLDAKKEATKGVVKYSNTLTSCLGF